MIRTITRTNARSFFPTPKRWKQSYYLNECEEDLFMPRATTKPDLIESANEEFGKIWELIVSMSDEVQNTTFDFGDEFLQKQKEAHWKRDKNLRDVLIHLYEWHQLLLSWVKANQNKEAKSFIPEPYNWRTIAQMNVAFCEKHQTTTYVQSQEMLKNSHIEVMDLIESFSNEQLFSKQHFPWTGTSTLGSYCTSATASHYNWAIKKIKKHIKSCKTPNKII